MKALTVCQPYAHLIAIGEKRVENRTWRTNYRGPLAIHAGKSRDWLRPGDEFPGMAFGAFVAVCRLVDCCPVEQVVAPSLLASGHVEGPVCWILTDVRRLSRIIPARGNPGL